MPNLTCKHCGSVVRVEGLAAICSRCGMLVSVAKEASEQLDPTSAAEAGFEPAPLPRDVVQPAATSARYYLLGGFAAGLVLLLTLILVVLISRPPSSRSVVSPNSKLAPPATAPRGSEWFSETSSAQQAGLAPAVVEPQVQPSLSAPVNGATQPALPPPPHAELAKLKPRPPGSSATRSRGVTDQQTGESISRGVEFLVSQFSKTRLKDADRYDPETFAGLNALAFYAVLHAGQALGDPRLSAQSPGIKDLLDRLKEYPMSGNRATYSRSLRISALASWNRPEDRATIDADLQWLIHASMRGAYTYSMPPADRAREQNGWDNSNSQYGALGVWAAAEAGLRVPGTYWNEVEQHWTSTQVMSGGWGYGPGDSSARLSMTAAGTCMLFVARDQLASTEGTAPTAYMPLSKAITRALEWLDEGDNAVNVDSGHRGYTLYGLERAGLASGYKYFGSHDWYSELAAKLITDQQKDGSWTGGDGTIAETSFALLFLSRGRHPVLIAKLKFDGHWNNRPRDVHALSRFASYQLERPLNWEIADLQRDWWDWSDSPLLLISSDRAPALSDAEVAKLRAYAQAGGLILLNTERNSEDFNKFAADLAARAFGDYSFDALDEKHDIYSIVVPLEPKPPLKAVSNGARLLLIHSPMDLSRFWQARPNKSQRASSDLALNIAVYASGRRDLRNRLESTYVPDPTDAPVGTIPLARVRYHGNWDPEPAAWPRMARIFQNRTGIELKVIATDPADLKYEISPIAVLTGTAAPTLNDAEVDALRVFVTRGGTLLIDACGGSPHFAKYVQDKLLFGLFPDSAPRPLGASDALLSGAGQGMCDIRQVRLRSGVHASPQILILRAGAGWIIYSPLDLTSGLAGANTADIAGYQPAYCQDFVSNTLLWVIQNIPAR